MYESKTVQKTLALLELIADGPRTFHGICQVAGMPRATAHRLLSTLTELGYARYDAAQRSYRLGFKVLRLGRQAERQSELVRIAVPWLERLRDATDETAHLAILDGRDGVFVDIAEPREGFHFWTPIGTRRPLHAGAAMRALMAFLPDEQLVALLNGAPLARLTRLTTTQPPRLREELRKIRRRGYSVSFEETQLGAAAVAAPIFDHTGRAVASVAVVGPVSRFRRPRQAVLIAETRRAASGISHELGFHVPRSAANRGGAVNAG